VAFSQGSSPITAAGPRLILTGLPFLSFESTGKCIYSVIDITIIDQFLLVKRESFVPPFAKGDDRGIASRSLSDVVGFTSASPTLL